MVGPHHSPVQQSFLVLPQKVRSHTDGTSKHRPSMIYAGSKFPYEEFCAWLAYGNGTHLSLVSSPSHSTRFLAIALAEAPLHPNAALMMNLAYAGVIMMPLS